ncbi:MAG: hypothetical protein GEU79_13935 [Acidimicrobiia bacterium]|nr:hypothetical protein [Acidimicrobiia bacterium]
MPSKPDQDSSDAANQEEPHPEKSRSGARVFLAFIAGALAVAMVWAGVDFLNTDDEGPGSAETTVAPGTSTDTPISTQAPNTTVAATSSTTTTTEPITFDVTVPNAERARYTMDPYTGLGAWLDVFDWTVENADDRVGPGIVDQLAEAGVQTLYIQAGKWDSSAPLLEPNLLKIFLERAEANDMSVVGWYVPGYEDPQADLERLLAITSLPLDGVAVDIEATSHDDVTERNRNAVALAKEMRRLLPDDVIGAIVLEPVLLEDVNPNFWPSYPWEQLAANYDVWLPMNYWTNRSSDSPWTDPHLYTVTNVERVRELIGKPEAPVHVLGGIADETTVNQLRRFRKASEDVGAIGGSIYDVKTTDDELWPALEHFQTTRVPPQDG